MPIVKIENSSFDITKEQEEKLVTLLKKIKDKEKKKPIYFITESFPELPVIVQIVIAGAIWDLAKKTFKNYQQMIMDIINEKRDKSKWN